MGQWHMAIDGQGVHHNTALAADADRQFDEFVQKLRDLGHQIESATFTHGARQQARPLVKE